MVSALIVPQSPRGLSKAHVPCFHVSENAFCPKFLGKEQNQVPRGTFMHLLFPKKHKLLPLLWRSWRYPGTYIPNVPKKSRTGVPRSQRARTATSLVRRFAGTAAAHCGCFREAKDRVGGYPFVG